MRFVWAAAGMLGVLSLGEPTSLAAENSKDRGGASSISGTGEGVGGERAGGESRELAPGGATNNKNWQVRATAEYHHLIRQNDLSTGPSSSPDTGDAANKNVLYYLLGAYWEPTPRDRFTVQWGVYERFLADQGETGVRSDDAAIAYTRIVPLPEKVTLRIQPRVDIGLSYESVMLSSLIAAPRLGFSVDRDFGPLNLYALTYGYVYLERYTSYAGGSPNPQSSIAGLLEGTFTVPRYKQLQIGVLGVASTVWYHQVKDDGSNPTIAQYASTSDPRTPNQPFQNTFGAEIFARYTLPPVRGVTADVLVAYADGDPTIGYQDLLHDGVGRFNLFYRHVSEFYADLTFRY